VAEPARTVPFVGLTGGMGAGKSTALAALEDLGAATLSSDAVVHDLYEHDERLREAVVERWGPEMAADGSIDRAKVAERAFADSRERAWLESQLWPLVGERVASWLSEVRSRERPPRAAVVEVPLLFEAGLQDIYDATIAVVAAEDVRARRAASRGHAREDARAARQLSQEEKAARATFAVRNDGDVRELTARLSEVLERLERG